MKFREILEIFWEFGDFFGNSVIFELELSSVLVEIGFYGVTLDMLFDYLTNNILNNIILRVNFFLRIRRFFWNSRN